MTDTSGDAPDPQPGGDQPLKADRREMGFNPATYEYLYQGRPFTGEMYEYGTDGAVRTVKAISEFWDGVRHGMSRSYYPDGRLHSEARYRYGRPVGVDRTWYHSGQLAEELTYTEHGDLVSTRRWNEDGELTYTDSPEGGPRRH